MIALGRLLLLDRAGGLAAMVANDRLGAGGLATNRLGRAVIANDGLVADGLVAHRLGATLGLATLGLVLCLTAAGPVTGGLTGA